MNTPNSNEVSNKLPQYQNANASTSGMQESPDDLINSLSAQGSKLKKLPNTVKSVKDLEDSPDQKQPNTTPRSPQNSSSQSVFDPQKEIDTAKSTNTISNDELVVDLNFEDTPKEESKEPTKEAETATEEEPELQLNDKETNLRKIGAAHSELKKAHKTLKTTHAQILKDLEDAQKKVKAYETGEAIPEVINQKEQEISELSRYKKLHNLKGSKEYQEAVTQPLESHRNRLKAYAEEYGIPEDVLVNASSLAPRDQNEFLSNHFDSIAGTEVKSIFGNIRALSHKAQEMEAEPAKALQALQEESKRINEVKKIETRNKVFGQAKDSWAESIFNIQERGEIDELLLKENDEDHNNRFTRPLRTAAANEYTKIMKEVVKSMESGEVSKNLTDALSNMTLLAMGSATAIEARKHYKKQAVETESAMERLNKLIRPSIGNNTNFSPTTSNNTKAQPKSVDDHATALIDSVMGGRK